ncbi:MAG: hypothetical protein JXB04_07875 [Kiritimatiellae bacterium]|nr:hypothetical protein [Kiritimatiellia bacterium]
MTRRIARLLLAALLLPCTVRAASNINDTNRYAYGANVGWVDWVGDSTNGAVVGQWFCHGYIYGANIGWIRLGDGSPDNGWQYSNAGADDYGVNHDGAGNLRGYAYGANVGWINFEENGAPKVDLVTGRLSGSAYGANIGWISLSNLYAYVQADSIDTGRDSDGDNIPDTWEYMQVGSLTPLSRGADLDSDGVNDDEEYPADTNPNGDDMSYLRMSGIDGTAGTNVDLTWESTETRLYAIEKAAGPTGETAWVDSGEGVMPPDPGSQTTRTITDDPATTRFYRVRAVVPLAP